ncbi:hypothetical protein [Ferrovibrio xuzhouensis]|uniref:Secreted protein n=1 Tax=Ferrovibrio xuzhouensis TaxID=1576914 RepID=A0ABV7VI56_9PROT
MEKGLCRQRHRPLYFQILLFCCDDFASAEDAEQIQQDDDRDRNPQEPEQNATHEILLSKNRMQLGCVMMMQLLSGFSMVCARRI